MLRTALTGPVRISLYTSDREACGDRRGVDGYGRNAGAMSGFPTQVSAKGNCDFVSS